MIPPKKKKTYLTFLGPVIFLHFKQYYTHLHTFFHPQVFQKITNNIS